MKKVFLFFALVMGVSFLAAAQSTPRIVSSQVRQTTRISQGVANGELTKRETRMLQKQQRNIQNKKRIVRADGVVTKKEKAQIRQDQKIANRSIYRQKHDAQKRF